MSWLKRRLPRKRWIRVCLYIVSVTMMLLASDMILTAYWRRIDISPETTNLTAPLDEDGLPDYVREFNTRAAAGITMENNAAPEFLRIIGTETFPEKLRAKVMPPLGLPTTALPAQCVSYEDWRKAHPEIKEAPGHDESDEMLRAPWKAGDHPHWARWLDEQSGALPPAFKALEKSRFYIPYASIGERPLMVAILLPNLSGVRKLSNLLTADAMHRLGEGDVAGFRRDVLGVLKLSTLVVHDSSTIIEYLVGVSTYASAFRAMEAAMVAPGSVSEDQAKQLLHDVEIAPRLPGVDRRILTGERWMFLDSTCTVALMGSAGLLDDPVAFHFPSFGGKLGRALIPIHYNEILREGNKQYDRLEDAFLQPTYQQRKVALLETEGVVDARHERANRLKIVHSTRAMTDVLFSYLMTSIGKVDQLSEMARTERELARLAMALRIYHVQHGEYPESPALLAPAILPGIPQDSFVAEPLKYRREGKGYLLYSVGPNEKDDGGADRFTTHGHDWDIVVRAKE